MELRTLLSTITLAGLLGACASDPVCGNGQLEEGEVCDGAALGDSSCVSEGFGDGALTCRRDCRGFDRTQCGAPATCGNNQIESPEVCDGATFTGGGTCEEFGRGAGVVMCAANCADVDLSMCGAPVTCGNNMRDTGELCDGADLGASCGDLGFAGGTLACQPSCLEYDTSGCDGGCVAQCGTRECGVDPMCGESCGTCGEGFECSAEGMCNFIAGVRFNNASADWTLPDGGHDAFRGFWGIADTNGGVGEDTWTTMDIDGDGRPDLVVTGAGKDLPTGGSAATAFGPTGGRFWRVFKNNGAGFERTPTQWAVPDGGHDAFRGFWGVGDTNGGVGEDTWTTMDIDGDGRPDLVVTGAGKDLPTGGSAATAFGATGGRFWRVFKNNGAGFERSPTQWMIPDGGHDAFRGFWGIADTNGGVGEDTWTTMDIDGDGRPDLVVTGAGKDLPTGGSAATAFGATGGRFWRFFKNNGSGFERSPAQWMIPDGGHDAFRGFWGIGDTNGGVGEDTWTTMDIDGDGRPDLVVTGAGKDLPTGGSAATAFGATGGRFWRFFKNNGSGFERSPAQWMIPDGGHDAFRGFWGIGDTNGGVGEDTWTTMDIDGDGRPDLVVTGAGKDLPTGGSAATAFGPTGGRFWRLFKNNGSGFERSPAQWMIPDGGHDAFRGFWGVADTNGGVGEDTWTTMDINGDRIVDLVVTGTGRDLPTGGSAATAYGTTGGRLWRTFLGSR